MKMQRVFLVWMAMAVLGGMGCAPVSRQPQVLTGQYPQSYVKEGDEKTRVNYLLYLPESYPKSRKRWPLMLFLHGLGECGNDLEQLKVYGPPKLIAQEGRQFPFIIVSPQCPEKGWWASDLQIAALSALLDDIVARYRVDVDRIYVTGLSMGGFGTWRLAVDYPRRFAAIAPICGSGDPAKAERIKHLPVWVFHGAKDGTVPLRASEAMVAALKKAGGNVRFTVYPDAGHDSWTETYNNPELYEWLLKQKRAKEKLD